MAEVEATGLTCRVLAHDAALLQLVGGVASTVDRPARPLYLQALLQLPHVADERGAVSLEVAHPLIVELAEGLPQRAEWIVTGAGASPRLLRFHLISAEAANDVMRRFHYLGSPRSDGPAYGLTTVAGDLVALCVSSPLDVASLSALLIARGRPVDPRARVISRVFAFEGAPRNTVSYLLARVAEEEQHRGVSDLVTYLNPNMGFTGASYRASGWHLLGDEPGTTYRYLDGRYVTDRVLAARFGRRNDDLYRELLGNRFSVSLMPLAPLLVFHRQLA